MNPLFVIMLFLCGIALWFLLAFVFKPLGSFLYRLWKDAINNMKEESEEEKDE